MFPPIDDDILRSNPKFAQLYKSLTTDILHDNGSTIKHPAKAERAETRKELMTLRAHKAQSEILKHTLRTLPLIPRTTNDAALPRDLLELIVLLTAQLHTTNPPRETHALLAASPIPSAFAAHSQHLSSLLTAHLLTNTLPLTRLLNPTTNASFLHRAIPALPSAVRKLQQSTNAAAMALRSQRSAQLPLATQVLRAHRQALTLLIQHLERTTHGALARHSKAGAQLQAVQGQTLVQTTKLLRLDVVNAVYTDRASKAGAGSGAGGIEAALRGYGEHLRDGRSRLRGREDDARRELRAYGVGRGAGGGDGDDDGEGGRKERTMREIARVYGVMSEEVEEVRREVEKLRKA